MEGTIAAINPKLNEAAELINKDPNEEAWIMEIVIPETDKQNGLLDAETYRKMVEYNREVSLLLYSIKTRNFITSLKKTLFFSRIFVQ